MWYFWFALIHFCCADIFLANNCSFDIEYKLDPISNITTVLPAHEGVWFPVDLTAWLPTQLLAIKVGFSISPGIKQNITQFEFSLSPDGTSLWYDASSLNGNPFYAYGYSLSAPGYMAISCHPNQTYCPHTYNTTGEDANLYRRAPVYNCSANVPVTAVIGID